MTRPVGSRNKLNSEKHRYVFRPDAVVFAAFKRACREDGRTVSMALERLMRGYLMSRERPEPSR
jgi:hypothetical protein